MSFTLAGGLATVAVNEDANLTMADLRQLGRFQCLKTLTGFAKRTPALLEQLSLCPNIQGLKIDDGPTLTADQWNALKAQTHIERLKLGDYYNPLITNADIEHLSAMRQLKEVDLTDSTGVNDTGIAHLASLRELEVLNLERTDASDSGLEFLPSLSRLRILNVAYTHITRVTLERLLPLQELISLNIGNTRIEGDPVPALLPFPKLHTLGLSRLEVSDASLPQLAQLPALRVLDLGRTQVTRFNLALMLSQTKWKKVRLEKSLAGYSDDGEDAAFREFCRKQDVLVDVDYE